MEFDEMIFIELLVNKMVEQAVVAMMKTFDGTEIHDVTSTIEDGKEDKIVAPVEIAVNKAVIEVDVRVNAEETHDESDKGTVAQAIPHDATTVETLQEAVEVREVFEQAVIEVDVCVNHFGLSMTSMTSVLLPNPYTTEKLKSDDEV